MSAAIVSRVCSSLDATWSRRSKAVLGLLQDVAVGCDEESDLTSRFEEERAVRLTLAVEAVKSGRSGSLPWPSVATDRTLVRAVRPVDDTVVGASSISGTTSGMLSK